MSVLSDFDLYWKNQINIGMPFRCLQNAHYRDAYYAANKHADYNPDHVVTALISLSNTDTRNSPRARLTVVCPFAVYPKTGYFPLFAVVQNDIAD